MARHQQRQAERHARHYCADIEDDGRVAQPDQAEGDRQDHRGDVVDGEGDRRGRRDVGGIGDLLEIGALRQDEREEDASPNRRAPGCIFPQGRFQDLAAGIPRQRFRADHDVLRHFEVADPLGCKLEHLTYL